MALSKRMRLLTTEITMSPYAEAMVLAAGRELRRQEQAGEPVVYDTNKWRYLPRGDYPVLPLTQKDWRVYIGGFLAKLLIPKLDGSGIERVRFVAIFVDPRAAKTALEYERTMVRRALQVHFVDGHWFARMKYESKEGLIRTTVGGHVAYTRPKTRKRRWNIAPADWPRDHYGQPLSARAVAKRRAEGATGDSTAG